MVWDSVLQLIHKCESTSAIYFQSWKPNSKCTVKVYIIFFFLLGTGMTMT